MYTYSPPQIRRLVYCSDTKEKQVKASHQSSKNLKSLHLACNCSDLAKLIQTYSKPDHKNLNTNNIFNYLKCQQLFSTFTWYCHLNRFASFLANYLSTTYIPISASKQTLFTSIQYSSSVLGSQQHPLLR